ncbi:MAG TPA: GTPase HflX [bacterium]|nr:GTPase HflX [bacterium]
MEKVLLVKLINQEKQSEIDSDIQEMKGLISTAGGITAEVVTQKRADISAAYFIGRGKAEGLVTDSSDISLIVFDAELKPVQVRNLEKITGLRVIDRTQLILDIFAGRARTAEGKLQVEYAQLNYILPRLTGRGRDMMQQAGSGGARGPIGTRGPGETKLETDRRKIKRRLEKIKEELKKIKESRARQRERRKAVPVPLMALVGYTNAGKTMLLNRLTKAGMLSEDKLFATLDPKIKQFMLPNRQRVLISDTVGFIKKLPTYLVAAFRATLEEVSEADVILHVSDLTDPEAESHREVVRSILAELGVFEGKEIIEVYNKLDLAADDRKKMIISRSPGIYISAKTGEGIGALTAAIEKAASKGFTVRTVKVPAKRRDILSFFYNEAVVTGRKDTAKTAVLEVICTEKTFARYQKLIKEG